MIVKHRRGTSKEWRENNIIPEAGELVIEECTDGTRRAKFGTGYLSFSDLPYIDEKLWEEIDSTKADINTKITNLNNRLSRELKEARDSLKAQLATEASIRNEAIKKLADDVIKADEDRLKLMKESDEKLQQGIDALENELQTRVEGLEAKTNTGIASVANQVTNLDSIVTGKLVNQTALFDKKLASAVDDIVEDYNTKITGLTDDLQAASTDLAKVVAQTDENKAIIADFARDAINKVNSVKDSLKAQIAAQAKRIDNLIAPPEGDPVTDAELIGELQDIRVDNKGNRHESAGTAVRSTVGAVEEEIQELRESLASYIDTDAINGLYYDIEGNTGLGQPYMLYLKTSNGEVLQDTGVQIVGGAGGGPGGGSSSSSTLKISYITKDVITVTSPEDAKLSFLFSGIDSSGDTLSQANAQWKVNGTTVARGTVNAGENTFDASSYVRENDTVKVLLIVTDDTGSVVTKTWNIQYAVLKIASDFNDKIKWTVGEEIPFNYKVEGALKKTVVFKLNGEEIGRQTLEAAVSGFDRGSIAYSIPAYDKNGKLREHGAYLLEVFLEATINGDTVTAKSHVVKDLIWYDATKVDAPPIIGVASQHITIKQYETAEIVYTVYDSTTTTPSVTIEVDGHPVSSLIVEPNKDYGNTPTGVYTYSTAEAVPHEIKIICGKTEKVITVVVDSLGIDVSPVTEGLVFDFRPVGVSNDDIAKRLWSYDNIHMRVSDNFDWRNGGYQTEKDENGKSISGTEHFCIKAGSTATIDYKLFANDAKTYGKEFKLIFKTRHVTNPEAIFLSCIDNTTEQNHIGVKMGVHQANIYGQSGNLELAYSEDDIIEFEFNISRSDEAVPMVMGYEDGVPSRPLVYDNTYNFKQSTPKEITLGSPDCDLLIYRFKVYNASLTTDNILKNFIADARTSEEMISRYNRNQIYTEGSTKLDPDVLAEKCPWLRVYKLSAPHFTNNKSDKVKNTTIQQIYKAGDPVLDNWVCYNAQHSGQGTSSNNYGAAGRNLDFIMNKDGAYFELGDGSNPVDQKITLTRKSVPVAYLNAKVNIASSNNLTNAILASRYNKFNPYKRPFVEREGINTEFIKDTMEFYNCVIFIQETDPDMSTHREFADNDWHFYAIGNIGDSKKTDNTRATDPDDRYECCVEIMDVGLPLSDFPRDTMMNAMGYSVDEKDSTIKHYTWAKDENLGILYERKFTKTADEVVDLSKDYYVEVDGKMALAKSHYTEVREYLWATDANLGILYEKSGEEYEITQDPTVNYDKTYYIKEEVKDELDNITYRYVDAMGYTIKTVKTNDWVANDNIDNLYELEYFVTEDPTVNYNKTYYVDILEHDDFSEDYTYGWRYLWEDGTDEENEEVLSHCKQAWIDFYRFVTTSSDEEFRANLKNYFVVDSALYYYLFTTRYCMVDNRAKNTFWHYGKAADGTYKFDLCWDYDNDTSLGLNNYGKQVYRYGLEDIDRDATNTEIFRESDSTFFCRLRDIFADKLQEMYQKLEEQDTWHAASFINECDAWQDEFPEELWRLDINRKYIRTYNSSFIKGGGDKQFLVNMCNGKMKYHRRQWERNQEAYMASKYQTPRALGDSYHANFRVNRFESTEGMSITPNYQFTLTPYSHIYLNVQYGGTKPIQVRANPNVATPVPFAGALSADIINIGSAAAISDFGDLSAIYPHTASVQHASRVKTLKLGTTATGYTNTNFTTLTTGENALLEELDLTNITFTGDNKTLDLEKQLNLKKFYAFGTNLTSVLFADGGKLTEVKLPMVNTITLKNLIYLSSANLKLENDNYNGVVDLTIENCPQIDAIALVNKCANVKRVRLIGIDFGTTTYNDFIAAWGSKKGITASGGDLDNAALGGNIKFDALTGEQFSNLRACYPDLKITYDALTSIITFKDTDCTTTIHEGISVNAADYINPVYYGTGNIPEGMIAKPTKAPSENGEFSYDFLGWSTSKNIIVSVEDASDPLTDEKRRAFREDVVKHVEGNRVLYPVFEAIRCDYIVTFINPTAPEGTQELAKISVPYGSEVIYKGDTPRKQDTTSPDNYEFIGWFSPDGTTDEITKAITFEAQFAVRDEAWYTITVNDISDCVDADGNPFQGYELDPSTGTMSITKCKNDLNPAVKIPESFNFSADSYEVTKLGGFQDHINLELILLPNTVQELSTSALAGCSNLAEITLPESLLSIGQRALQNCTKLKTITIPQYVHTIMDQALAGCYSLKNINIAEGNDNFKVVDDCLIDVNNKQLIQGLALGKIPSDESVVTSMAPYCFDHMPLTAVNIPSNITEVPDNAFSWCTVLETAALPSDLTYLGYSCFAWCYALTDIVLPEKLKHIMTYAFNSCNLKNVTIPASVDDVLNQSFGSIETLQTVTFKKALNADGSIKIPTIGATAFAESHNNNSPITFNLPWTAEQHYRNFVLNEAGTEKDPTKDPTFGAVGIYFTKNEDGSYSTNINFNYDEEAN